MHILNLEIENIKRRKWGRKKERIDLFRDITKLIFTADKPSLKNNVPD